MKLVFIHGAPATGKYTTARELAALTGLELYHNHLVVDNVLTRHPFGSESFVAERDREWRAYFEKAAREQRPGLIFTFNPENSVPQDFIDWLFIDLPKQGVSILSICLTADEATIEARLNSAQRREFRKLTDLDLYRRLRDSDVFLTPVIPRTDLKLNTAKSVPAETARQIAGHFKLS